MHDDLPGTAPQGASITATTPVAMPNVALRDYFAASAMQGLATRRPAGIPTSAGELARFAFEIADAMIVARADPPRR